MVERHRPVKSHFSRRRMLPVSTCGRVSANAGSRLANMKPYPRMLLGLVMATLGFAVALTAMAASGQVRPPVHAGRFYPDDPDELRRLLATYTHAARPRAPDLPEGGTLRALILPHAGYIYAGPVAAFAGPVLESSRFTRVVVLAPDHHVGFRNGMISAVGAYATPLGSIPLDPAADDLRAQTRLFGFSAASDRREHALEVVLPYLQYYLQRPFSLIPIVLGPSDAARMSDALLPLLSPDTLLVVSSDLSHFLPYEEARRRDRGTLDLILGLDGRRLGARKNCACGKVPLQILLHLARRLNWQPHLLHYATSGDSAGDREQVVGYAAVAFFSADSTGPTAGLLGEDQGQILVRLARQTLRKAFGIAADTTVDGSTAPCFDQARGVFVTLEIDEALRGCIGHLKSDASLRDSVPQNAIQAAFRDPRFPPLQQKELARVRISVSVLTPPAQLVYTDAADLVARLRPHRDGVIIRKGFARATYLPQVWEQLPDPADFLSSLCRKAGLSADAWRRIPLEVQTYQAQVFHEPE